MYFFLYIGNSIKNKKKNGKGNWSLQLGALNGSGVSKLEDTQTPPVHGSELPTLLDPRHWTWWSPDVPANLSHSVILGGCFKIILMCDVLPGPNSQTHGGCICRNIGLKQTSPYITHRAAQPLALLKEDIRRLLVWLWITIYIVHETNTNKKWTPYFKIQIRWGRISTDMFLVWFNLLSVAYPRNFAFFLSHANVIWFLCTRPQYPQAK